MDFVSYLSNNLVVGVSIQDWSLARFQIEHVAADGYCARALSFHFMCVNVYFLLSGWFALPLIFTVEFDFENFEPSQNIRWKETGCQHVIWDKLQSSLSGIGIAYCMDDEFVEYTMKCHVAHDTYSTDIASWRLSGRDISRPCRYRVYKSSHPSLITGLVYRWKCVPQSYQGSHIS